MVIDTINKTVTDPTVSGGVMTLTQRRADRVVLYNISWQQFENLLEDLGENRAARVAYDDGSLEIMTPLLEHEYYKETISIAIQDIAEVLDRDYESLGSTTWKREIQRAGVEPDNCFYFQNEMFVEVLYREGEAEDEFSARLYNIEPIGADPDTEEAITSWYYWCDRGYEFCE